ncbi:MAG: helix-turn-helix domain-containing protein [Aggregatilineales bacterium]
MSDAGKRLIESVEDAIAFAEGKGDLSAYGVHIPDEINVRKIRESLEMSQTEFAEHYGFSVRTLQDWEQGRRVPSGVAKNFLILLHRAPETIHEILFPAAE